MIQNLQMQKGKTIMDFRDVLSVLRSASDTQRDKGGRFEKLMRRYFLTSGK